VLLERNTLPRLSPSSEGEVRAGGHQRSQNQMCEMGSPPNGAPVFTSPGPVFLREQNVLLYWMRRCEKAQREFNSERTQRHAGAFAIDCIGSTPFCLPICPVATSLHESTASGRLTTAS
jgi:hypothetical protein